MCKIIAFTDTKRLNLKKCLNDIGNTLLKTEQDGFGYAVQGKSGVFGEKTVSKHFKTRLGAKHIMNLPILKKNYSMFGMPGELTGPGIFHGRTSTNSEGLINTHPMQRPDENGFWHLIHNGVVTDCGPKYSKLTDNDSEDVLYRLMESVTNKENLMESVETHLEGYYAFAAIDSSGLLHVARDEYATLYMAWSETLATFIIATTESLVNKLNKMLDAKIGPIDEIEDNVYMIFKGNELMHHQFIQPKGFTRVQAAQSTKSLGRELPQSTLTSDLGYHKLNGDLVTRGDHHRFNDATKFDADQSAWDAAMHAIEDADDTDGRETDYYKYRHELDNMDASYTITDQDGTYIKLHEFRKLDHISQELCTILRGDGTIVELDENEMYTHRLA